MSDKDQCRVAFEQWAKEQGWIFHFNCSGKGDYFPDFVQAAWITWRHLSAEIIKCAALAEKRASDQAEIIKRHQDTLMQAWNDKDAISAELAASREREARAANGLARLVKELRSFQSLGYFTNDHWQRVLADAEEALSQSSAPTSEQSTGRGIDDAN